MSTEMNASHKGTGSSSTEWI